jgi:hypothetical protein
MTMSQFTSPLGGDVRQAWNWWLTQSMRQVGLVNIEQTVSSDPELERRIVTYVAGYGKQLGRISEALLAVLAHQDVGFTPAQQKAIEGFRKMAEEIAKEKQLRGSRIEDMLDRVIDEAREKKDSPAGRLLIDRMREAVASLASRD